MEYDAIVAGLGPGGSMAAYQLARRGLRVAGYDIQASYRKVCGDALTIREEYRKLVEESGTVKTIVKDFVIAVNGKEVQRITFRGANWYIIDKGGLVGYLRSLAEAEGAQLHRGPAPRHGGGNALFVDARGPYAHFPLRRGEYVIVYRGLARAKGWDPETALLDFVPEETGLFWLFPNDDKGVVNFGGGFRWRGIEYAKKVSIEKLSKLVDDWEIIHEASAPITAWSPVNPAGLGIVRIGEAGGLLNSLAGEGNRFALLSGIAIGKAFDTSRDVIMEYRRLVSSLASEARLSRVLIGVVESMRNAEDLLSELPLWFWRRYLEGRLGLEDVLRLAVTNTELGLTILKGIGARSLVSSSV